MKIALGSIHNTARIWGEISNLKKPPKVSYRLMKYYKNTIEPELKLIEEQRMAILANYLPEGQSSLNPGCKEYDGFIKEFFGDFLTTETEIKVMDMTMEEFIDAISGSEENTISEMNLLMIEKFFKPEEAV